MNNNQTTVLDYLTEMKYWLDLDITTYKSLFPTTAALGLYDYTAPPGVPKPPNFQPSGYLSIPIATSILSAMDFCGFCIKGDFRGYSRTTKNIKTFYKVLRQISPNISPSNSDISKLIQSCRHGFAHKFFPNHQIAVGYYPGNDLFISITNGSVLNTAALIEHIEQGLTYIITTTALHSKMQHCYSLYIDHVENKIVYVPKWKKLLILLKGIFKR